MHVLNQLPDARPLSANETQLVSRAIEGDRASFDQLVRPFVQRNLHVALRIVGNREDAEDAVQDALLKAHRHLDSFSGRASFGTWLTSIVVRTCLDHERKRNRRPEIASLAGIDAPQPATQFSAPPEALQQRERMLEMNRVIAALPHRLRTALVLKVIEGLDYDAIADAMSTSPRSVQHYVCQARRELARVMTSRPGGDRK